MKISLNIIKHNIATITTAGAILMTPLAVKAQTAKSTLQQDTFTKTLTVPPSGTDADSILVGAPSPEIYIKGEKRIAAIVIDLKRNILYKYNADGEAECAYLIASGKKSTPTDPRVRIVTNIETYPYKTAPATTVRRNNPNAFGPKALILEKLDPETGERSQTGEFLHGNNNAKSIGKYVSNGCMRMDNAVIKKLSKQIKRGDIIIIQK